MSLIENTDVNDVKRNPRRVEETQITSLTKKGSLLSSPRENTLVGGNEGIAWHITIFCHRSSIETSNFIRSYREACQYVVKLNCLVLGVKTRARELELTLHQRAINGECLRSTQVSSTTRHPEDTTSRSPKAKSLLPLYFPLFYLEYQQILVTTHIKSVTTHTTQYPKSNILFPTGCASQVVVMK